MTPGNTEGMTSERPITVVLPSLYKLFVGHGPPGIIPGGQPDAGHGILN